VAFETEVVETKRQGILTMLDDEHRRIFTQWHGRLAEEIDRLKDQLDQAKTSKRFKSTLVGDGVPDMSSPNAELQPALELSIKLVTTTMGW
jgi:hypothetical protein